VTGADRAVEDPRADLRWGSIPAMVADAGRRFGEAEALVEGDAHWPFAGLTDASVQFTRALLASGVGPGDRVGLWAPNCAEWVVAALGTLGAGAVLVPVNTRFKGPEAAYVLGSSRARLLCTVQGFLGVDYPGLLEGEDLPDLAEVVTLRREGHPQRVCPAPIIELDEFLHRSEQVPPADAEAVAAAVGPDDVSDIIYTSGTTGRPKGAMATHGQTLRTFGTWSSIVGLTEGDRYLVVNPFFHTFGYKAGVLACLMTGATIVPEPVFDPGRVLERIEHEHISVLPGPPTLYQALLDHPDRQSRDISSLRLGVTGAAVVPVELVVAMREELGCSTVLTAYGLTESTGTVTMCRRDDPPELVATTSGRALPDLEVQVVAAEGAERPRGLPGEIVVRGYTVMPGYFEDEAATKAAVDAFGWLHTGDIGVMDEDGNVTVTDRLKDMYTVGGFNAYPAEIEAALRRCTDVAQVAVVGVPDERLGEVGCAYVVLSDGGPDDAAGREAAARRLLERCRETMANYKVPRHVVVVDELPLNASGKVLKVELRRRFAVGADPVVTAQRSGSGQSHNGARRSP